MDDKQTLEIELLLAQKEKTLAEARVLRRTTPLTEVIKVFGSMILGVGGVVAAFAGYQVAEMKVDNAALKMASVKAERDTLDKDVKTLAIKKETLAKENEALASENKTLQESVAKARTSVEEANDKLNTPALASNTALNEIRQSLNATGLELSMTADAGSGENMSLDVLVPGLFSSKAGDRGKSYQKIMSQYANSADLVPALLTYADVNRDNENGIYNTLVVLSHVNQKALQGHTNEIKVFANSVRDIGPKTNERVDKLLSRLPAD